MRNGTVKQRTGLLTLLAFIFLVQGVLWFKIFYCRGGSVRQVSSSTITTSTSQRMIPGQGHDLPWYQSLEREMRQQYSGIFHFFASLEFVTSLIYIVTGIALLRSYWFAYVLAQVIVCLDFCFKLLVFAYHAFVAIPVQQSLDAPATLLFYFPPDQNKILDAASYFTGSFLLQENTWHYLGLYFLYFCFAFFVLKAHKVQK